MPKYIDNSAKSQILQQIITRNYLVVNTRNYQKRFFNYQQIINERGYMNE